MCGRLPRWLPLVAVALVACVAMVAGAAAADGDLEIDGPIHLHEDDQEQVSVTAGNETVTAEATLTVDNTSVATVENGTLSAEHPGETVLEAVYDNTSVTTAVTVVPPVADLLEVWDRSMLPLRVDHGVAAHTTLNQFTWFDAPPEYHDGTLTANRDPLGTFSPGTVPLEYALRSGADTTQYSEEDVLAIGGQVDADSDPLRDPAAIGSLDGEALETLNEEVTFETVAAEELSGIGEVDLDYEVGAGQHVVLLLTVGDHDDPAVAIEEGNVTVRDEATLIGAEGFLVHDHESTVANATWETPGLPATVDLETDLSGTDHDHLLALYDQETFENSEKVLNVTTLPDENFSRDDLTIHQEIGAVEGHVDIDEDYRLLNASLESHAVPWALTESNLAGVIASNGTYPQFDQVSGDTTLEASLASTTNSSPSDTLTLETPTSWAGGEYRLLHIASNESDVLATTVETLGPDHNEPEKITLDVEDSPLKTETETAVSVSAVFPDGTETDLGDAATLATNDSTVGSVDDGTLVAHEPGTVELTATFGNTTATKTVSVEPIPPIYEVTIENDGGAHAVGFPGPVAGSLADALPSDMEGISTVYTHDADGWSQVRDFAATSPEPLETVVITTTGAGPDEIPMTIEFEPDEPASSIERGPGWTLVPSPSFTDADDAFGETDALLVLDQFGQPSGDGLPDPSSFHSHVVGSSSWGSQPPTLSPFGGYWVYLESAISLPVAVSDVADRDAVDEALGV